MQPELPEEEEQENKRGPLKFILALFLVLLLVLWAVPYYSIKTDPRPSNIPTLEEVLEDAPTAGITYKLNSIEEIKQHKTSPLIKHVAAKIASSCNEVSDVCYAKAMFYFVRDNFNYVPDPAKEYIETPEATLLAGSSDCENQALILYSLLKAVNIKSRFVLIPRHAYLQALIPEAFRSYKAEADWVNLDPTCKSCEFGEIPYQNLKKEKTYLEI